MFLKQLPSQRWRLNLWQESSSNSFDFEREGSPIKYCVEEGNIEVTKQQKRWYFHLKYRGLGQGDRSTGAFPEFLRHFVPSPMEGKKMEVVKCTFLKDVTVLKTQLHLLC